MNPEIKAKWVEALRSGRYEQTSGRLKDGDAFCCIGVLCDVYPEGFWDESDYFICGHNKAQSSLTDALNSEIGLSFADEGILLRMNDDYRMPFHYIADWIEANL